MEHLVNCSMRGGRAISSRTTICEVCEQSVDPQGGWFAWDFLSVTINLGSFLTYTGLVPVSSQCRSGHMRRSELSVASAIYVDFPVAFFPMRHARSCVLALCCRLNWDISSTDHCRQKRAHVRRSRLTYFPAWDVDFLTLFSLHAMQPGVLVMISA